MEFYNTNIKQYFKKMQTDYGQLLNINHTVPRQASKGQFQYLVPIKCDMLKVTMIGSPAETRTRDHLLSIHVYTCTNLVSNCSIEI